MPLDPSIFMNSAALYSQNMNGLRDSIGNAVRGYQQRQQFDAQMAADKERLSAAKEQQQAQMSLEREKLEAQRNSPEALAKKLEAESQIAAFDVMQGKPVSPERQSLADMFFRSQSKVTLDPGGRPTVFNAYADVMGGNRPRSVTSALLPQDVGGGQPAPVIPVQRGSLPTPMRGDISAADIGNEAQQQMSGTQQPTSALADTLFQNGIPVDAAPTLPPSRAVQMPFNPSPKTIQAAEEAVVSADAKGIEAYNKEKSETQAKSEAKLPSINMLEASIDKMLGKSGELPGGMLNRGISMLSNAVNRPNSGAMAEAKVSPEFSFTLAKMKELTKTPGEGSFTDADQRIINEMVYDKNDSIPVIQEKLKTLKDILGRYKGTIKGGGAKAQSVATHRWNPDTGSLEAVQ